jgi:AraC-like DNA-binding protein
VAPPRLPSLPSTTTPHLARLGCPRDSDAAHASSLHVDARNDFILILSVDFPKATALRGDDQMDIPTSMMRNPFAFRDRVVIQGLPHVLDLGLVRDVPGHARRLLDFWVFGMILNGTIGLQIGSSSVRLQKGDYYILPEGVHHFGLDESLFDAAFFHFVLPSGTKSDTRLHVELEVYGELPQEIDYLELYRFIERHYKQGLLTAEQVGVQLLAVMEQITVIQHHRRLSATASGRYLAGAILDLLQSHYPEQLTAKEISRRFGYSYTHLERVFRKEFGVSIHQRLLKVRIDAAAHGLQMGKSIREVATETGFRDYYYFLRAFRRVRGTTPGTFQKTFHATIEESGVRAAERLKARAARHGSRRENTLDDPGLTTMRVTSSPCLPRWPAHRLLWSG